MRMLGADQFARRCKTEKLVLIKKPGRPADSPSAYRHIVLLEEVCKFFDRVIADHLAGHLWGMSPDLADDQFSFRQRRSTVDAIIRMKALTSSDHGQGHSGGVARHRQRRQHPALEVH